MRFKFEMKDLVKLPNILCYIRIAMVPWFLYVYFTAVEPKDYYFATLIVLASGLTDFLDGQIARRCNMITDLGKLIDPIADTDDAVCNASCINPKNTVYVPACDLSYFKRNNFRCYGGDYYKKI